MASTLFYACQIFYGYGGYALVIAICSPFCYVFMDSPVRYWNVLCWNVRGLNDHDKWDPIRNKIEESSANIFCLQETKRSSFDLPFIRKFAPKRFDKFDYCPSEVLLEVSWFAGLLLIFPLFVKKSNSLASSS